MAQNSSKFQVQVSAALQKSGLWQGCFGLVLLLGAVAHPPAWADWTTFLFGFGALLVVWGW